MDYEFPAGITAAELDAAIAQHNEEVGTVAFIRVDGGEYWCYKYIHLHPSSFPPFTPDLDAATRRRYALLRECRGLLVSKETGRPLARRFHKFMNLGERAETDIENIDWSRPHRILLKLDGSMVSPIMLSDGLHWTTNGGLTSFSPTVAAFVPENYKRFAADMLEAGRTPIFEWCSPAARIVILYGWDQLFLTAIRDNETGAYADYAELLDLSREYGVDLVPARSDSIVDAAKFVEDIAGLKGEEGVVVVFDNGHMLKVKADEYRAIHRIKSDLHSEKVIFKMYLDGTLDDAKPRLSGDDRRKVEAYETAFSNAISCRVGDARAYASNWHLANPTGTSPDLYEAAKADSAVNPMMVGMIMHASKGKDVGASLRHFLSLYCGSGPRMDMVRPLLDGLRWDGIMFTDDEDAAEEA